MARVPYYTPETLSYLTRLQQHNTHEWFREHKAEYEALVREPSLRLIADLQEPLAKISPYMRAEPKKVGGSLFRVMRDTRRPHPEGPYKPWIGLKFFHEQRREVHAPSFFVHLAPDPAESFAGGGLWKPEPPTLKKLRVFLEENPNAWRAAVDRKVMRRYTDEGEWLTHMPRGFTAEEPLASDLRRRSFIWDDPLTHEEAFSPDLPRLLSRRFKDIAPIVDYLSAALELSF